MSILLCFMVFNVYVVRIVLMVKMWFCVKKLTSCLKWIIIKFVLYILDN